jgi:hypothetical protein
MDARLRTLVRQMSHAANLRGPCREHRFRSGRPRSGVA